MTFIPLDISILMESQSNTVFQEQVDLYPGAARVKEVIDTWKCACNDPTSCSRKAFQLVLRQASHGDKDMAAKFIAEAAESCTTHEDVRDLMVRFHDKNCSHSFPQEGDEGFIVLEGQEAIDLLFGGGTKH